MAPITTHELTATRHTATDTTLEQAGGAELVIVEAGDATVV